LVTILFCSASLADPVLFTCKRPAWASKEGCDEANTYETYAFYAYAESILEDQAANKDASGYLRPKHVFTKIEGCDLETGYLSYGRFEAAGEIITLWLGDIRRGDGVFAKKVVLDLETLKAELSDTDQGTELSCTARIGNAIPEVMVYDNFYHDGVYRDHKPRRSRFYSGPQPRQPQFP
jgi:hypothetical protein